MFFNLAIKFIIVFFALVIVFWLLSEAFAVLTTVIGIVFSPMFIFAFITLLVIYFATHR